MKKTLLSLIILPLALLLLWSCSKSDTPHNKQAAEKSKLNTMSAIVSVNDFDANMETDLGSAITNNDPVAAELVIHNMAEDIVDKTLTEYGINLRNEFDDDDINILLFGLIDAAHNKYITSPGADIGCFFTAVSSVIGVSQARGLWKTIVSGSYSAGTIIDALKLMGGRVAGIFTVAVMVYEVGACLNWWNQAPPEGVVDPNKTVQPVNLTLTAIPIDFFLDNKVFYNLHYNALVTFLNTQYGFNALDAHDLIEQVYNSLGDPGLTGSGYLGNYFLSQLIVGP